MGSVTHVWCADAQPPPAAWVDLPGSSVHMPAATSDDSDDDSDHVNDGRVVQDERMPHDVTHINATVYYSSDGRSVHHMLSADAMISWGTGTKGSWGLVEEKGLSNVPPGVPPGPPISRPAVGRPQSARRKPAAGPTSGRHPKRDRKVPRTGARRSARNDTPT